MDNFDFPILKNPIKNAKTLNFRKIMQPDIREEIKKVIFLHLKYKPLGTVQSEMAAINRFTGYTYNAFPELQSLLELERSHRKISDILTYRSNGKKKLPFRPLCIKEDIRGCREFI